MQNQPVYSDSPWVMPRDPDPVAAIFRRLGRPVTFKPREIINLGGEKRVYLIEKGLIATFAGGVAEFGGMIGFFPPGSTLGAVKAVSHRGREMALKARVFFETEALAVDTVQFMRELERDPAVYLEACRNFILKDEASIEGLLLNDMLRIPDRLARMVDLLFSLSGAPLTDEFRPLPEVFTVTDLAGMIHATRVAVSNTLSGWRKAGLIGQDGKRYLFNTAILGEETRGDLGAR